MPRRSRNPPDSRWQIESAAVRELGFKKGKEFMPAQVGNPPDSLVGRLNLRTDS